MKKGKIFDFIKPKGDRKQKTKIVRIQRKNGKIVQDCDVYIGRACNRGGWKLRSSKWKNPYSVKSCGSHEKACEMYRKYIKKNKELMNSLGELEGKVLGCWCKPNMCHGDVLVDLVESKRAGKKRKRIDEVLDPEDENIRKKQKLD